MNLVSPMRCKMRPRFKPQWTAETELLPRPGWRMRQMIRCLRVKPLSMV